MEKHVYRTDATRLAFIGGAYGNVPGLSACLADAQAQGARLLVGTGDYFGFCGQARSMYELIPDRLDLVIAGNHEQAVANDSQACGCGHADPEAERRASLACARQGQGLDDDQRLWLGQLPERCLVATPVGQVLVCHGSPDRINEFLYASTLDRRRVNTWLDNHNARSMVCGHSGLGWVVDTADGRLAANSGSCGKPDHDGDPAVHYLLLDVATGQAVVRRVTYDHSALASRLLTEGVEAVLVQQLVDGRWAGGCPLPVEEASGRHQPGLLIRRAARADLPAIQGLMASLGDEPGLDPAAALATWLRLQSYPYHQVFLAERGGEVLGTYVLLIIDNLNHGGHPSAMVENVVVAPHVRGGGIGAAMMRHARDCCRAAGCYKLALSSNQRRLPAHAFYERLGFGRHGFSFSVCP